MSSILKQMSALYNRVKWAYSQGEVPYPRVANDYITHENMRFYEYPHKPMKTFDEYSVSLQQEEYPFSKAALPLYLTHKNISTPATLLSNLAYIDQFFDDALHLRPNTENLEENLDKVIGMFRGDAEDLYMREVTDGVRQYTNDPLTMKDEELLAVAAKDGDVLLGFKMTIMPYSIELAPYAPNKEEQEQDEEQEKQDGEIVPLVKPQAFKAFVSPSRNFEDEVVSNPVMVQNIHELIVLENVRIQHQVATQRLEDAAHEHDMRIENNNIMSLPEIANV